MKIMNKANKKLISLLNDLAPRNYNFLLCHCSLFCKNIFFFIHFYMNRPLDHDSIFELTNFLKEDDFFQFRLRYFDSTLDFDSNITNFFVNL